MPDSVNEIVKLTGFDDLERKLEELPARAAREALRNGLKAGGEIWREEMAGRVRQGWHHGRGKNAPRVFGYLSQHIIARTQMEGDLAGKVDVGPERGGFWARFLEFGTRKMAAFPFIRVSFESRKNDVLQKFKDETRAAIERAGMKLK